MDSSYETYTVTVDSINTTLVNSIAHKYYKVTYSKYNAFTSFLMVVPGTIYERFGDMLYLFNFTQKNASTCSGDLAYGIMCYQDSTFGLKQFTSLPCNFSNPTKVHEIQSYSGLKIYPNPVSSMLNIESSISQEDGIVKIIDILGRTVFKTDFRSKLDLKELKPGIYFLQLYNKEKLIAIKKIIKE